MPLHIGQTKRRRDDGPDDGSMRATHRRVYWRNFITWV